MSARFVVCFAALVGLAVTETPARQLPAGRPAQDRPIALVGGTLIDGTGGPPLRNSVVLIGASASKESERPIRCPYRTATTSCPRTG